MILTMLFDICLFSMTAKIMNIYQVEKQRKPTCNFSRPADWNPPAKIVLVQARSTMTKLKLWPIIWGLIIGESEYVDDRHEKS